MQHKVKKRTLRIGLIFLCMGIAVLSVFAYRRISRELYKQKLLNECVVLEIPDTGEVGFGNYCGDNRLTIVICTDDGTQRQVVVCKRV